MINVDSIHPPQIIDFLYDKDPSGATLAFADMMRKQIVMPAHLMDDLEHRGKSGRDLFTVRRYIKQNTKRNIFIYML